MSKKKNTSAPTYNAYSEEKVTDGIQVWTRYNFDFTKTATQDDLKAFEKSFSQGGPLSRIESMEEKLTKLENVTPSMQLHIDAIRVVHAKVQEPPFGFTRERLLMLDQADSHWLKIMMLRDIIPAAQKGAKYSKTQSEIASAPRKMTELQQKSIAKEYWQRKADGDGYGLAKDLAGRHDVSTQAIRNIAKKYKPN